MTSLGRAALGAGLGALVTLGAHPASRPFLTAPIPTATATQLAAQIHQRSDRLPAPERVSEAALWMQMAAERMENNKPLRKSERESVLKIAEAAARHDPDNAFWHQMQAVVHSAGGESGDAIDHWVRASKKQTWNDYQSELLTEARTRIRALTGANQSWQTSYVYYARSESSSRRIERYARELISTLGSDDKSLLLRYATLRNGSLMRDGSRSVPIGMRGSYVVELSSYPQGLSSIRSPKKLLLAQIALYNGLMQRGHTAQASEVLSSFRKNEAWRALTQRFDTAAEAGTLGAFSLLTVTLPSALLLCGMVGCLIWMLGRVIERQDAQRLSPQTLGVVAGGVGFLTYFLSQNVPASAVTALCVAFLSYGLERGRGQAAGELGPLFTFLTGLLAFVFLITFVLYVAAFSLPSKVLAHLIGLPGEFFGNQSMFIGLSAIIFGLLLLAVAFWSLAQRRSISSLLSLAMRRFGAGIAVAGLGLTCIVSPLCIYLDRSLDRTLGQLVDNEPVYHLLR
jgi:hypothetical protein